MFKHTVLECEFVIINCSSKNCVWVSKLKCMHVPYLLYISYVNVHSSRAYLIHNNVSVTLVGERGLTNIIHQSVPS